MKTPVSAASPSYTHPSCRKVEVLYDENFLASDQYGDEGNPGANLDPGKEYEL